MNTTLAGKASKSPLLYGIRMEDISNEHVDEVDGDGYGKENTGIFCFVLN